MLMNTNEYIQVIETIKSEIKEAQYKATVSVNTELMPRTVKLSAVFGKG